MSHGHDPFDLVGQQRARQVTDERDKLSRLEEADDLKWLMGSKRGRRIVWRLLERCGVYRTSFNTNALSMAFNEGSRNNGLYLLSVIQAVPEKYVLMLQEQKEHERSSRNADSGPN